MGKLASALSFLLINTKVTYLISIGRTLCDQKAICGSNIGTNCLVLNTCREREMREYGNLKNNPHILLIQQQTRQRGTLTSQS